MSSIYWNRLPDISRSYEFWISCCMNGKTKVLIDSFKTISGMESFSWQLSRILLQTRVLRPFSASFEKWREIFGVGRRHMLSVVFPNSDFPRRERKTLRRCLEARIAYRSCSEASLWVLGTPCHHSEFRTGKKYCKRLWRECRNARKLENKCRPRFPIHTNATKSDIRWRLLRTWVPQLEFRQPFSAKR